MRAPGPGRDDAEEDAEAAVPANKLTGDYDNPPGRFRLLNTAFDFFYDMDAPMIRALGLSEQWKKDWCHIETF